MICANCNQEIGYDRDIVRLHLDRHCKREVRCFYAVDDAISDHDTLIVQVGGKRLTRVIDPDKPLGPDEYRIGDDGEIEIG